LKKILSLVIVLVMALSCCAAAFADPIVYNLGDRTLSRGMTGPDVLELQQLLQGYAYYTGTLDGSYGAGTYRAVREFQSRNNIVVTGIVDANTATRMMSGNVEYALVDTALPYVLSSGMTGEGVKELQRQLRQTYYYTGKITGTYDSSVTAAVKAFQASVGLKVDGKAGEKTKDLLYNRSADIFNGGLPVRSLSSGDRGYDVFVLQNKLIALNYLSINPNGLMNTDTVAALKNFQRDNALNITGSLNSVTKRALWPTAINTAEEIANEATGTEDDPYQEPKLSVGSHGSMVANAQMRLKAAGYLLGSCDGIFGAVTQRAVKNLQKDYGLKVDGIIGVDTWAILKLFNVSNAEPDVVDTLEKAATVTTSKLQRGSRGSNVIKLQQALISLGLLSFGEDDGVFGLRTYNAVRNFQKSYGLTVDGIVGYKTLVKLNEVTGVIY